MTDYEDTQVDPIVTQDGWDELLAQQGLGPIDGPDTLGMPSEIYEARRRAEELLGTAATKDEIAFGTVEDLRSRGVHVRDLGYNRWDYLFRALAEQDIAQIEYAGDLDVAVEMVDRTAQAPFEIAATSLLPDEIQRLLSPIDEREREILRQRFGLDSGEPRTLEEVGEHFNLTRVRIREIEARAMAKLSDADQTSATDLLKNTDE